MEFDINSPVVSVSNIYVSWTERDDIIGKRDAYIAVSNDKGQIFNTTKLSIAGPGPTQASAANLPVVSGNDIYVTWIEQRGNGNTLRNISIEVSNDNGGTFNTQGLSMFDNNSLGNVRSVGNPVVP